MVAQLKMTKEHDGTNGCKTSRKLRISQHAPEAETISSFLKAHVSYARSLNTFRFS
jgi:hypothetical protein